MNATDVILAALGSSAFTAIVGYISNRNKSKNEAEKVKAEAYNIFSDTYNELIANLRLEIQHLRDETQGLRTQVGSLLKDKDDSRNRIQELEKSNKILQGQLSNL